MRKLLAAAALVASFVVPHFTLAAFDASNVADSTGLSATGNEAYGTAFTGAAENTNIATWIGSRLIAPAFSLVGVIFFALMVYAGFLWMTARGDSKQVQTAKDILRNAIIGIIIVLASYALTSEVMLQLFLSINQV